MKKIIIAIDGPAGSGKSTTAKIAAERLGYVYIDTGAMYRAVTLAWLRAKKELTEDILCKMLDGIHIELKPSENGQRTILNGEDVSDEIRTIEVTKNVSPVSAIGCVREKLVEMQRELGKNGAVVMDGRDIGTIVFPNAELKIFLIASAETRAQRRTLELKNKGIEESIEEIKKQIIERDRYDSSREISPLRKAYDAIEIDTSNLTIEGQVEKVVELALEKINLQ
ncbi:MAG: (d)CMP kinase [Bacteroidetes bacterium]|nr:MAG: (d)CMP kinase [Bacteroidota bacterium]